MRVGGKGIVEDDWYSCRFFSIRLKIALVGLLYPMLITSINQTTIRRTDDHTVEKSQICKSLVIFVGINHLCAVSLFEQFLR